MVAKASEEAEREGLANARFTVGDATALELDDGTFDGAVTRFSLHHIPAPQRVVAEMARVVRPGGWVVVSDFVADPDRDVYAAVEEIERLRDPSHWSCLTAAQLRTIGEGLGLELETEQSIPFAIDFDSWLARGSGGPGAASLIEALVRRLPEGSGCFRVHEDGTERQLTLVNSLTRWRRISAGQSSCRARMAKACDQASGVVEVGMPVATPTRSGRAPAGVALRRRACISSSAWRRSPRAASDQAVQAVGADQGFSPPGQPSPGVIP